MSNINLGAKPKILVTGATGKTGSAVAARLLQKGWPVRAVVRKNDARSQKLQQAGAEVVIADMYDYRADDGSPQGNAAGLFLPARATVYDSRRLGFRSGGPRSRPGIRRGNEPVDRKPAASFPAYPPAMAGREPVFDDSRRGPHRCQSRSLCGAFPYVPARCRAAWHLSQSLRQRI